MRHTTQRLALLAVLVLGGACARPAVSPPTPSLGQLIQGYERETSPYYPLTASERVPDIVASSVASTPARCPPRPA